MSKPPLVDSLRRAHRCAATARELLASIPGPISPALASRIDLDVVTTLAAHGSLTALASPAMAAERLSPEVKQVLRQWAAMGMLRAQQNRRTWELALGALDAANVAALPLKGRSLALRLYGGPTLRVSGDVDVLVADADFSRARSALEGVGFTPPSYVDEAFYRREHHHVLLENAAGMTPVELHFKPSSAIGRAIPGEALIARSHVEKLDGRAIRVMAPEDEIVYLSVHAAVQAFTPMQLLVDIGLLARKKLDWDLAHARAREWKVEVAFATAGELARKWVGATIPELELGPAARVRVALALQVIGDDLLLSGFFGAQQRWTAWLTTPVLVDLPQEAGVQSAKNLLRVVKRRAHTRWPDRVPASWGA